MFNQGIQAIKGQSHARGLTVHKHADVPLGKAHQCLAIVSSRALPRLMRISRLEVGERDGRD